MKTSKGEDKFSKALERIIARSLIVAGLLFALAPLAQAGIFPGGGTNSEPVYTPLDSWSFNDTNTWTSDNGHAPVSYSDILALVFGDGTSLLVDSNSPAWLQYNLNESDGSTNLTLNQGSVFVWYSPCWASTNQSGNGPGECGRLLEVGSYTTNASYGWWSLYVDSVGANLFFTIQPGNGTTTTYLQAPISWTSNYWHGITLTYSSTNTALYLDGTLATNGPGITAWPGTSVQAGGFFIGSSSSGGSQAAGAIDDLYTYSVPLDSNTVYRLYEDFYPDYILNPNNYKAIASAPSNPTTTGTNIDAITGPGNLQWVGTAAVSITNANQVWITNTTFTVAANGSINLTFTIQGGLPGLYYDVFANSLLSFGPTGVPWAWMGQGTNSGTYLLNISSVDAFLILGTPQDSSNSFLTDAYQLLVSKTNPYVTDSDQDGIPTGWEILLGLNPNISNFTSTSERANYGYTPADWLNAVSGSKNGSISTDNEGNVQSVSQ